MLVEQSQSSTYLKNSFPSCNKNIHELCTQINAVVYLSIALRQRVL